MWDLTNVKSTNGYDVLPAGDYTVIASAGELKDTKSGDGKYCKVEFTISGGDFDGRKLWHNFNVQNANPKAVEIGRGQIKAFFEAAGVKPEHMAKVGPDSFAGQSCVVHVKVETDSYGEKNVIKSFKKAKTDAPQAAKPTVKRLGL